jgi:hypothetical protein
VYGARGYPLNAALAAGLAALVLHTWLYAAFLEDPVTWTLLAVATALMLPKARVAPGESEPTSQNGHVRDAVVPAPAQ